MEFRRKLQPPSSNVEKIKSDIAMRSPEAKGDAFSINIDGKTYTERKDAGELLLKKAATLGLQGRAANKNIEEKCGHYAGFPVSIRTTLDEAFTTAKLYAVTPNFKIGADIKRDSNPVGLLRSFHDRIYKDMEKRLAENEKTIEACNSKAVEYKKISESVFPKKAELLEKENRYAQVMEVLRKDSEEKNKRDSERPLSFPWQDINTMRSSEIRKTVSDFYEKYGSLAFERSKESSLPSVSNAVEIQGVIKEKYSLTLPQPVIATIDKGITDSKISPEIVLQLTVAAIEESKARGYTWQKPTMADTLSAYMKDKANLSSGDFLIKISSDSTKGSPVYDAFRVLDSASSKYLGSEPDIPRLQNRVEQYSILLTVNNKINETIALSAAASKEPVTVNGPSAKGASDKPLKKSKSLEMDI